jgi:hypothetical protein
MIVPTRGPGTGGDVQTIQVSQRSGIYMMPAKDNARSNHSPAMLVVGVGIAIILLAFYYLLPRSVRRYFSAAQP